MLAPGGHRIGLVQPDRVLDRLPEPLDVRLAENGLGPGLGRSADQRPGDPLLDVLAQRSLDQLGLPGAGDPGGIEICQQPGLRIARKIDLGRLLGSTVIESVDEPGRRPGEHLFGAALDQRAAHAMVGVVDVDEARPDLVGVGGDRSRQVGLLGIGLHEKELAGLNVRANLDGELGVSLEPGCADHAGNDIPPAIWARTLRPGEFAGGSPRFGARERSHGMSARPLAARETRDSGSRACRADARSRRRPPTGTSEAARAWP